MSGELFFKVLVFLYFGLAVSIGLILGQGCNVYEDYMYKYCVENFDYSVYNK